MPATEYAATAPEYRNPRDVVRGAIVKDLDASFKGNGQNVPAHMVKLWADHILDEYDRQIRRRSWLRVIGEGLLVNLVWWALTGMAGLLLYLHYCGGKAVTITIGQ